MASIVITYAMLGFPFLFGLMYESDINNRKDASGAVIGKKHTYWEWVLLGFSIILGIFILRYIRVAIKWKEAKQYILNKMGRGGDVDTADSLESSFEFYWKSVIFFPGWFLNYLFFPQGQINYWVSYIFNLFFLGYTTYYATYWFEGITETTSSSGKKYKSRSGTVPTIAAVSTAVSCLILSVFVRLYSDKFSPDRILNS